MFFQYFSVISVLILTSLQNCFPSFKFVHISRGFKIMMQDAVNKQYKIDNSCQTCDLSFQFSAETSIFVVSNL